MQILLVISTTIEAEAITANLSDLFQMKITTKDTFIYHNIHVDILVTGIGTVFTVYKLTKAIQSKKYDFVINVGIAGTFKSNLDLGTVVHVVSEQFGDLGMVSENAFFTIFDKSFVDKNELPFTNGILRNPKILINTVNHKLPIASGLTVNCVNPSQGRIDELIVKFNCDIETMEGAAFFYVCLLEKVNFIELRAISNFVSEANRKNWNIPLAIQNLSKILKDLFTEIQSSLNKS